MIFVFLMKNNSNRDITLSKKREKCFKLLLDLYSEGLIEKKNLFLLLPKREAEAIIMGSKIGREGAKLIKFLEQN